MRGVAKRMRLIGMATLFSSICLLSSHFSLLLYLFLLIPVCFSLTPLSLSLFSALLTRPFSAFISLPSFPLPSFSLQRSFAFLSLLFLRSSLAPLLIFSSLLFSFSYSLSLFSSLACLSVNISSLLTVFRALLSIEEAFLDLSKLVPPPLRQGNSNQKGKKCNFRPRVPPM